MVNGRKGPVVIDAEIRGGVGLFRRIQPKRPMVNRKGKQVLNCFYFKGTGMCLGPLCYWPKAGACPIYTKMRSKIHFKAK
jgi:hypothetical protein